MEKLDQELTEEEGSFLLILPVSVSLSTIFSYQRLLSLVYQDNHFLLFLLYPLQLFAVVRVSDSCSVMPDSLHCHGLYVACQAPLSMEFSRKDYWSGLPCPSPAVIRGFMDIPLLPIEISYFSWLLDFLFGGQKLKKKEKKKKRICSSGFITLSISLIVVVVCSVTQSCLSLCNPMDCSMPSLSPGVCAKSCPLSW